MATKSTATTKWLKYFAEAGLPSNVSANYAIIFTENRIQPDMLLDLNKEYLYDMGIRVMGDVIAILRYARTAYTQEAQQKILGDDLVSPSTINKVASIPQTVAAPPTHPKISPVSRLLNHYTRRPSPVKQTAANGKKSEITPGSKVVSLKRNLDQLEQVISPPKKMVRIEEKPIISTKESGTGAKLTVKGSVFRRLGESSVSSTTDTIVATETHPHVNSSSIFKRLGPSTSAKADSSTIQTTPKPLQYRGVFKIATSPQKTPIRYNSPQETATKVVLNKSLPTKTILTGASLGLRMPAKVHSRLGSQQIQVARLRPAPAPEPAPTATRVSTSTFNQQNLLVRRSLAAVGLQQLWQQQKPNTLIRLSNAPRMSMTSAQNPVLRASANNQATLQRGILLRNAGRTAAAFNTNTTFTRSFPVPIARQRIVRNPSKIVLNQTVFDRLGPQE